MSSSECQICYAKAVKYTIQCGSSVPHQMCFDCEREWRLKAKPTSQGRFITCPFCRKEEKEPGLRGRSSYEAELKLLYQQLYSRPSRPARPPRPARPYDGWMERSLPARPAVSVVRPPSPPYVADSDSDDEIPFVELLRAHRPAAAQVAQVAPPVPARRIPSTCKNVTMCQTRSTSRKCNYPGGCTENVCRACKMCASHFQFNPVVTTPVVREEIWD